MITYLIIAALVVVVAMLVKQVRRLNRDVTTLFRLRAEEIERDGVTNLYAPTDAAELAVTRHVQSMHRR